MVPTAKGEEAGARPTGKGLSAAAGEAGAMFPSPRIYTAERESTLREFIEGLGKEVLYAYDQRVVVVLVNGERRWPSSNVRPGDRIAVLPIIAGG